MGESVGESDEELKVLIQSLTYLIRKVLYLIT